uniref:Uncharacterized protein n=1 Tax=Glossina pallidipes TaxID=7398 RepID=A0A1A9ZBR2_GLOPL
MATGRQEAPTDKRSIDPAADIFNAVNCIPSSDNVSLVYVNSLVTMSEVPASNDAISYYVLRREIRNKREIMSSSGHCFIAACLSVIEILSIVTKQVTTKYFEKRWNFN